MSGGGNPLIAFRLPQEILDELDRQRTRLRATAAHEADGKITPFVPDPPRSRGEHIIELIEAEKVRCAIGAHPATTTKGKTYTMTQTFTQNGGEPIVMDPPPEPAEQPKRRAKPTAATPAFPPQPKAEKCTHPLTNRHRGVCMRCGETVK